ncbi:hypothetical protein CDEST_10461 [Colletotrichum destructivum]|uniref:Uncharacterized protein n=1 Tax=Colletotrichum destructivum TaxID=34406 RepID=A0AAX4IQF1_9PEZI|nr:hypothetical protein CDEST_10461 [Colletotrichum destructivum]
MAPRSLGHRHECMLPLGAWAREKPLSIHTAVLAFQLVLLGRHDPFGFTSNPARKSFEVESPFTWSVKNRDVGGKRRLGVSCEVTVIRCDSRDWDDAKNHLCRVHLDMNMP